MNIRDDARFMRNIGVLLLVLTGLAFAPKYFLPVLGGDYAPPSPWMHPHAMFALLWTIIFVAQPALIAKGHKTWHRRIGYFALIVAIGNVISGVAVQLDVLPTSPDDFSNVVGGGFRLFHSTPAFIVFLIAAIVMRRRTHWHLRFMYQTAIAAIATILGRIYLYYGQLPEPVIGALIPVGNLIFILILPAYDFIKYRKVHPASWIGLVAFILFQIIVTPFVFSDYWVSIATKN